MDWIGLGDAVLRGVAVDGVAKGVAGGVAKSLQRKLGDVPTGNADLADRLKDACKDPAFQDALLRGLRRREPRRDAARPTAPDPFFNQEILRELRPKPGLWLLVGPPGGGKHTLAM